MTPAKRSRGVSDTLLVDTLGPLLVVVVHVGNLQDRDGALSVLARAQDNFPTLRLIWADGGYAGQLVQLAAGLFSWVLETVKRNDNARGFVLLPRRWVVERTFAWLGRYRRLSKDYELLAESSEAMVYMAMIQLMLRRLRLRGNFSYTFLRKTGCLKYTARSVSIFLMNIAITYGLEYPEILRDPAVALCLGGNRVPHVSRTQELLYPEKSRRY